MLFSKTIAALSTFAAFVAASPVAERDTQAGLTCFFIMTPNPDLGVEANQPWANYAIGHTVAVHWTGKTIYATYKDLVRHNDGTYDVEADNLSVDGVSNADVKAFVESWDNTDLDGGKNKWHVDAANCV